MMTDVVKQKFSSFFIKTKQNKTNQNESKRNETKQNKHTKQKKKEMISRRVNIEI